jgi:hypothetical protein
VARQRTENEQRLDERDSTALSAERQQPEQVVAMAPPTAASLARRSIVVSAVVAIYITLGFLLRLDPNSYLLLGIPITLLFQVFIQRRPLRALWLRDAPPLRLDAVLVLVFLALAVVPVITLVQGVQAGTWPVAMYGAVSIVGAFGAAYATRAMTGTAVRQVGWCLASAGVIGIGLVLLAVVTQRGLDLVPNAVTAARVFGFSLLQYVAVSFVIEEVFFRGALDSYIHRSEADPGWVSAIVVSALWGLWHLPISFPTAGWGSIPALLVFQIAVGVPLSIWWRRSGNLAVPSVAHALIDAVRNVLI